ncbi:hypothetical protein GGS23DRAFT_147304 [Durotheca rogersii]|uniref:uncharacterized protein n=1 Tax=Durotheca rogersii TaxID=419775 RepID=UPI002220D466|nr:uncharacterized protein GGS23DRAFT_147304 [Durotheca rogersii]KAI5861343.1 hypothetical protein GGS23DRAFT_147304 [Durotheca rogersii]
MGKDSVPRNWPPSIRYLSQPSYAAHLTEAQREAARTRGGGAAAEIPRDLARGPSAAVRIVAIGEAAHPARGQRGLFAARRLAAGALVLPYYGVVHSALAPHGAAHEASDYDLWLDRDAGLAVDAHDAGNEARFVNDYRGVRARPNCEFRECWDPRRGGERCMAVFVLPAGRNAAGIAKGEELLVSYGKGFWSERSDEHRDGGGGGGDGDGGDPWAPR